MGLLKRIQYVVSGRDPDQEPIFDPITGECGLCGGRGLKSKNNGVEIMCPLCWRWDMSADEEDEDEVVDISFQMISGPK